MYVKLLGGAKDETAADNDASTYVAFLLLLPESTVFAHAAASSTSAAAAAAASGTFATASAAAAEVVDAYAAIANAALGDSAFTEYKSSVSARLF